MINFNRVFAMIYRYWLAMKHSYDRLGDMFYWPAMDLFIWGLTGLYIVKLSTNNQNIIIIVLTGLIYWLVIWRSQYEITTNLLQEMWDRNLVNIFASPLKVSEWIVAVMIFGFIKMVVTVSFSGILALILYSYPIFAYGLYTIPIILSLVLTGWTAGFIVAAFIIRFGQKIQTLAWTGVALISPFSVLYYPLNILPDWAQKVAWFIPSSHIFEGMREITFTGRISYDKLYISFGLNILYLFLALWFFNFMFNKTKKIGLDKQ